MIINVSIKVDGRYVDFGWTECGGTMDALDFAARRVHDHVCRLGVRAPQSIEITVEEQE